MRDPVIIADSTYNDLFIFKRRHGFRDQSSGLGGRDVIKPSDAQSEALIRESSTSVFGVCDMPMHGARIVYGLIIKGQTRHKLL
jgi:hypothetical protein